MATQLQEIPAAHAPPDSWGGRSYLRRLERFWLVFFDLTALVVGPLAVAGGDVRALAYVPVALVALAALGLYRARMSRYLAPELPRIVGAIAVPLVVATAVVGGEQSGSYLRAGLLGMVLVLLARGATCAGLQALSSRGIGLERTLIVGAGVTGVHVARLLLDHPGHGLRPIGFVDRFDDAHLPLPVLGDAGELKAVVDDHRASRVIVAFGGTREPELVQVLRSCDRVAAEVYVLPRFFELGLAPGGHVDDLMGIPAVRLHRRAHQPGWWWAKRAIDVTVAGAALVLTAPLCAVLAVLVKLSSPGPVLFRQERVGQDGRRIVMLKFRTLPVEACSDVEFSVDRPGGPATRVGNLLRRTSLDELPQLLNVLRGEMSLVGPRPERTFFVNMFNTEISRYPDRHRVRGGITGWAQVHGFRGDERIVERVRLDNSYIEGWSLWRDVLVLARTPLALLRPRRARPDPEDVNSGNDSPD